MLFLNISTDSVFDGTKGNYSEKCIGEIINAGTGRDISINNLAEMIIKDKGLINHVQHHHPQSEIKKLVCNSSKAKRLLNWEPKISLENGISKLENWLSSIGR